MARKSEAAAPGLIMAGCGGLVAAIGLFNLGGRGAIDILLHAPLLIIGIAASKSIGKTRKKQLMMGAYWLIATSALLLAWTFSVVVGNLTEPLTARVVLPAVIHFGFRLLFAAYFIVASNPKSLSLDIPVVSPASRPHHENSARQMKPYIPPE